MLKIFNKLQPFMEDNYRRINVREYARIQNISPPHASEILKSLRKEGLLLMEEEKKYHLYHANRESQLFIKLQRAYYLKKFKELIKFLEEEYLNPVIILFGSFAKAEVSKNSDIDIAIFSPTKKVADVSAYENKLKRTIQLFTFKNREELPPELLNNILNGTILAGSW